MWRSGVAPTDATENKLNCNIGAQLQSTMYATAEKWKFTSCMTFGVHNVIHSEPFFWTTYTKFDIFLAVCAIIDMRYYNI